MAQAVAICGLAGDCNLVQQSEYARLFGVIAVALLGVAGLNRAAAPSCEAPDSSVPEAARWHETQMTPEREAKEFLAVSS